MAGMAIKETRLRHQRRRPLLSGSGSLDVVGGFGSLLLLARSGRPASTDETAPLTAECLLVARLVS
jgi:hypothetical protein